MVWILHGQIQLIITVFYDVKVEQIDTGMGSGGFILSNIQSNQLILDFIDTTLYSWEDGTYKITVVAYNNDGLIASEEKTIVVTNVNAPPTTTTTTTTTTPPTTTTTTTTPPFTGHTLSPFTGSTTVLDVQEGFAIISWSESVDSLGHDVLYDLSYREIDGDWFEITSGISDTTYDWQFEQQNVGIGEYEIKIRAYDSNGLEQITILSVTVIDNIVASAPGFMVILATLIVLVPFFRRMRK